MSTERPVSPLIIRTYPDNYNPNTLSREPALQPGAGAAGAVSVADGADVAEGTTTDAAWVSGAGTTISLLKTIASTGASAGLTDTQLRATAVPVSLAALPALATGGNVIGHVIVDSSGVVHVIIDSSATLTTNATLTAETTKVIGTVNLPAATVTTLTPPAAITGFALDSTVAKDTSLATLHTDLLALEADLEESHVALGSTTAPLVLEMVGGKTSDATPQYQPLPLTDGGIAVPVRNSLLEVHGRLTNAFLGQALLASLAAVPNNAFLPIEIPSFLGGL